MNVEDEDLVHESDVKKLRGKTLDYSFCITVADTNEDEESRGFHNLYNKFKFSLALQNHLLMHLKTKISDVIVVIVIVLRYKALLHSVTSFNTEHSTTLEGRAHIFRTSFDRKVVQVKSEMKLFTNLKRIPVTFLC
ncbi:CLUMA_CG003552, isoform A [Clunio marinus]|uniref:CLUMA_CG003552, isoform A n=1 Tax=Clunio marinus TaxID=568069 RepID=A0A1J1HP93_9DIPT|nr:CLUMA_CG003552, isoform A [Clunio marinus]